MRYVKGIASRWLALKNFFNSHALFSNSMTGFSPNILRHLSSLWLSLVPNSMRHQHLLQWDTIISQCRYRCLLKLISVLPHNPRLTSIPRGNDGYLNSFLNGVHNGASTKRWTKATSSPTYGKYDTVHLLKVRKYNNCVHQHSLKTFYPVTCSKRPSFYLSCVPFFQKDSFGRSEES